MLVEDLSLGYLYLAGVQGDNAWTLKTARVYSLLHQIFKKNL